MNRFIFFSLTLILWAALPAFGQQPVFRISGFELDQFDLSASSQSEHKKTDGNGDLYAIVKVKSNNPEDNLSAYQFDFGLMNHETTIHNGELWVYVQKNAQFVTVSRQGFNTVSKYDLGTSLESGKTYVLHISTNGPVILTQMVQFSVKPVGVNAAVMIKSSAQNSAEEMLGVVNQYGELAKAIPFGTYNYRIVAEDYHPIQGQITLNDRNNTLVEKAELQPNGFFVTLRVNADADIYVNGQLKGHKEWKGILKAGSCHVECKSPVHKTSSQYIKVQERQDQEFNLTPPEPLTGTLAVFSQPSGATIYLDGNQVGKSPQNINDLAVGKHTVRLVREGFEEASKEVEIQMDKTIELSMTLQKGKVAAVAETADEASQPKPLMKPTEIYASVGGQAVGILGVTADVGTYLKNFNVEGFFTLGFNSKSVIWSGATEEYYDYKPMSFGLKLGYGFLIAKTRLRITPQLGANIVVLNGKCTGGTYNDDSHAYSIAGSVGVRLDVALVRHIGLFLAPEYGIAFSKSSVYKSLEDGMNDFKKWNSGFHVRFGVRFSF